MKYTAFSIALLFLMIVTSPCYTQNGGLEEITESEMDFVLSFLASDEMEGRRTGEKGNQIAARFIAEYLRSLGYEKPKGMETFFQEVPLEKVYRPNESQMRIDGESYQYKEDYLQLGGSAIETETKGVFAGFGWKDESTGHDDYKGKNVKGKIVFVMQGTPEGQDPNIIFQSLSRKQELAKEHGAVGLIELYRLPFPWVMARNFFSGPTIQISEVEGSIDEKLPYLWLKEKDANPILETLKKGKKIKVALTSDGSRAEKLSSSNVIGVLPGSDPVLKDEYVLLTAHYDHVGTGKDGGQKYNEKDSIFNGARDNAMGTTALLAAAKYLSLNPPKRSVIVAAVTGEELGLLGSKFYSDHPVIPLEKTIFNLNTDGAGYNSTEHIAVIGFGRTGTDELITEAVERQGLKVFPNPAPEQGLFDRSDNVSFAAKGIPSLNFSPGLIAFDAEIMKTYHQISDHADTVDKEYLLKYCRSYADLAQIIANWEMRPIWKSGDKYEEAGKNLYGDRP